jgi:hypothetical protein
LPHFQTRHLSIRVPWHDAGWPGTVCDAPQVNGSCSKLKRIAEFSRQRQESQRHMSDVIDRLQAGFG